MSSSVVAKERRGRNIFEVRSWTPIPIKKQKPLQSFMIHSNLCIHHIALYLNQHMKATNITSIEVKNQQLSMMNTLFQGLLSDVVTCVSILKMENFLTFLRVVPESRNNIHFISVFVI